jgi:DNA topoisomerase-1
MPRERALATAFRLLDLGFFRIGGEAYAEQNGSYGLATIGRQHVSLDGDLIVFDYVAKSGKERYVAVGEPAVRDAVRALLRRRSGGEELLAYRCAGGWCDVRSPDINAYLKAATGRDISAKDFRTWGATVLMAVGLAVTEPAGLSQTGRKRAISRAVKEVAFYLGNTPAVARNSYIDPRIVDRYRDGQTIKPALGLIGGEPGATAIQGPVEEAVLELLVDAG